MAGSRRDFGITGYRNPEKKQKNMQCKKSKYLLLLLSVSLSAWLSAEPLTLERCLELAEHNNAQLKEAQMEVEKADEVRKGALTKYFPQVQAIGGGYYALNPLFVYGIDDIENQQIREALKTFFNNYGADLGLKSDIELFQKTYALSATAMQPVFFGGQIYNGNKLAELGSQAQQLRYRIARREVLRQAEEQYWLVMSLREKQKTLSKAFELIDTTETALTAALEAGLRLPADRLRLNARREQLRQQSLQLTHGIDLATRALALTIGVDSITLPDTLILSLSEDTTALSPFSDDSPYGREEEQLLMLDVEAQQIQKKIEVGKSLPKIMIGATYTYNNISRHHHNGIFFATVQIPLSQWWETSHHIRHQQLNLAQAQLRQSDLNKKLSLARRKHYYDLVEAREQLRASRSLIDDAKESYRLTLLNYEAGLATMSELLEAQTLLIQTQNKQADAYISYRLALRDVKGF